MNTHPPSRPSTLHQASRALGVPPDWLRKEAEAGRLPCLRAGDRLLFDLETIRSIVLDLARSGDPRREAGR